MVLIMMTALAACEKKGPIPQDSRLPARPALSQTQREAELREAIKNNPKYTEEQKIRHLRDLPRFLAEDAAFSIQEEKDRAELVLPAPAGWKPENVKRKIRLTLIPEKTLIRKGEKFRYRVEIQNVGQDTLGFYGTASGFIKRGMIEDIPDPFQIYMTPPGGNELRVPREIPRHDGVSFRELHFPASMTKAQVHEALAQMAIEGRARNSLTVNLKPGETLLTRPEPSPPNRFRELKTRFEFNKVGSYRTRLVFDDVGEHPDAVNERRLEMRAKNWNATREELLKIKEQNRIEAGISVEQAKKKHDELVQQYELDKLDAIGRTESNVVVFEVVP